MMPRSSISIHILLLSIFCINAFAYAFKQDKICGMSNEDPILKLNMGTDATYGAIPWIANFRLQTASRLIMFCSGNIINENWILTAAHCFTEKSIAQHLQAHKSGGPDAIFSKIKVYVGDHVLVHKDSGETVHSIKSVLIHSDYGTMGQIRGGVNISSLLTNDIALVNIHPPIKFGKYARPVCLPDTDQMTGDNDVFVASKFCQIAGWGATNDRSVMTTLQMSFISFLNPEFCEKTYGTQYNKTEMICAGDGGDGPDVCNGDSGGPFTCIDQGRYKLYGLVSFGMPCNSAKQHSLGVYTRIGIHTHWVDACIGSDTKGPKPCLTLLATYDKLKLQGGLTEGANTPKPIVDHIGPEPTLPQQPKVIKRCSCSWRSIPVNNHEYNHAERWISRSSSPKESSGDSFNDVQKCVSNNQKPTNWDNALRQCRRWESNLLSIKSLKELTAFGDLNQQTLPVWLGLKYRSDIGKMVWNDGTEVSLEILSLTHQGSACFILDNDKGGYRIFPRACNSQFNYVCENIESKYISPLNLSSTSFASVRRIKYCGYHTNHVFLESGFLYAIIDDDPLQDTFYAVVPQLQQRTYRILEFDYNGQTRPFINRTYVYPIQYLGEQKLPTPTEFGGLIVDPVEGKSFFASDTTEAFGSKVSTIRRFSLNGAPVNPPFQLEPSYYVTDLAAHGSGELYLCNNYGKLSIFVSRDTFSFVRDFGQWTDSGSETVMSKASDADKGDHVEYDCDPERLFFRFQQTSYVDVVNDWIYVLDQVTTEKKSRIHAFPVWARCPKHGQKRPYVNSHIRRALVDHQSVGMSVKPVSGDNFLEASSDVKVHMVCILYRTNVQVYYHLISDTTNEFKFITKFDSYQFTFGYHGVSILKNGILAIYDSTPKVEKIVLYDLTV